MRNRSCATLVLGASLLIGCNHQSQSSDKVELQTNPRRMTGVFFIGEETEEFQECQLDEPWNCFKSKTPTCQFRASDEANSKVHAALEKAGILGYGAGNFGVELFGTMKKVPGAGHLDRYDCVITARRILSIREVPSEPPPLD